MKNKIIKISVALMTFIVGIVIYWLISPYTYSDKIDLRITAQKSSVGVLEGVWVNAVLTNKGSKLLRLVLPGDGSEDAWRTPIIKWNVQVLDRPQPEHNSKSYRCGNIDALKWGEVFHLYPNQIRAFDRQVDRSLMFQPGTYKISMVYINDPSKDWDGLPLGFHNLLEMCFVHHSTRCEVISNEIIITISK